MKKIIMVTIIGLIACFYAQNMGEKPKEGYRIEIVVDTLEKKPVPRLSELKEIRFISPEEKVLKSVKTNPIKLVSPRYEGYLFYAESPFKVSGNKKYALGIENVALEGNWIKMERVLWNAQGKKKWTKVWKTYLPEAEGDPNWDEGISYNGSTVYVSYKDSLRNYWLVVYDTLGKELVKVSNKYGFRDIRIAPDGQIIIAHTGMSEEDRQGYTGDYLFFFSVAEAKKKIVKAWGENWSVGGYPLEGGKIELNLCEYPRNIILTFDEIPDDLSTLFLNGGEK
jgi:hypothetical protein